MRDMRATLVAGLAVALLGGLAVGSAVTSREFDKLSAEVSGLQKQIEKVRANQQGLSEQIRSLDTRICSVEKNFPEGRTTKAVAGHLRRGLEYLQGWMAQRSIGVTTFHFLPEEGERGVFELVVRTPDFRTTGKELKPESVGATVLEYVGRRAEPFDLRVQLRTVPEDGDALNWGVGYYSAREDKKVFVRGDACELLNEN